MRVLLGPDVPLPELYAVPQEPWLRVNMVVTADGAATGEGGTSRSINNEADHVVFDLLRAQADVIVVGAGTLRAEGYAPNPLPIVAVSRRGLVPPTLRDSRAGPGAAGHVLRSRGPRRGPRAAGRGERARARFAPGRPGGAAEATLVERGFRRILCEGGPHLLRDLVDQGCVDEVCVTTVPRLIGGTHPRITDGPPVDVPLALHTLVEDEGTLLARWFVSR